MQRTISLKVNARLLANDEASLKRIVNLLTELEDRGLIKEGKIVFDSSQDDEIANLFDKHLNP